VSGLGVGWRFGRDEADEPGWTDTKEIFFIARHSSDAEALTMVLINRVIRSDERDDHTRKYFTTIADNAPKTTHTLKRAVAEVRRSGEADWDLCNSLVKDCFGSQDYVEGRRAFMQKRRPCFVASESGLPGQPEGQVRPAPCDRGGVKAGRQPSLDHDIPVDKPGAVRP
jgi:enoyl-CoA hydratase